MNQIFINEAITNGLNAYINKISDKPYSSSHYYELTIIELLVKIYDRINIVVPYKTKYERTFITNLQVYGLSSEDVSKFINALNDYNSWLLGAKGTYTDSVITIHKILIKMILLKNLYKGLSKEEIEYYDYYLSVKEIRLKKILDLATNNIDDTINLWVRKRNIYLYKHNYVFEEIEPDLLTKTLYEKHGLSINEVKQLSNLKVNEINSMIINEEENNEKLHNLNPFKLVLSSGNGIVDTLVLFSIVLTEIFIGFLIAILG